MSDKDGNGQSRYSQRKEQNDAYRKKIRRFTFQLSLHDGEVREWFERQPDKGAYLKRLILADKERELYDPQEEAAPQETKVEKRMAQNYEIVQAVQIGGKEVVLGKDESSAEPYFCAVYAENQLFYQYKDCMVGDYAEIVKLFGARIQAQAEMVLTEQEKTTIPLETLAVSDCYPNDYGQSIDGKIVAVKLEALAPEYRTADHQLVLVDGGSGSRAEPRGNACFCINLCSGKHIRWERYEIQGEVKPERLPEWAKERCSAIQRERAETAKKPKDKEGR